MKNLQNRKTFPKGFTLLELIVVSTILLILSGTLIFTFNNSGDNTRSTVTENQYLNIKNAILGDVNLQNNGSIAFNGYISDTGELPQRISSLLIAPPDFDSLTPEDDKMISWQRIGKEIDDADWRGGSGPPAGLRLMHGWRGPYLQSGFTDQEWDHDSNGSTPPILIARLLDAWGNDWEGGSIDNIATNTTLGANEMYDVYTDDKGTVASTDDETVILLRSLNKDQTEGNPTNTAFGDDFPSNISAQTIRQGKFHTGANAVELPNLNITNGLADELIVGLIYPGLDLTEAIQPGVGQWHPSIINIGTQVSPILVEIGASASPTENRKLQDDFTPRPKFTGPPTAYRYQIALFAKPSPTDTVSTLAEKIVSVYDRIYYFKPGVTSSIASDTSDWNITP